MFLDRSFLTKFSSSLLGHDNYSAVALTTIITIVSFFSFIFFSAPGRPANFLRISIYLTSKVDEGTLWNIAVNDAGATYDPLTLLRTRTMFGRPDWKSIYTKVRMAIESGQYLPGREASLKTSVAVSRT